MVRRIRSDRSTLIIRLGVGILVLAALVVFVDARTIVATARTANGYWIAAAFALLPVNLYLEALKWRTLFRQSGVRGDIRSSLGSVLAGYALGLVTPARLGDYAGRVMYLDDCRKGSLLVLAGLDRLYSVWVYTFAGTIALAIELAVAAPGLSRAWWLTLGLGVTLTIGVGALLAKPSLLYAVSRSLLRGRWMHRWSRHFVPATKVNSRTGLALLLASAARFGVFCTQFVLLLLAFAPTGSIPSLYLGVVLVFFAKTVIPSISVFDLGIRESASVFFLGFFGVSAGAAFNASLLLFAVNLALPALMGVVLIPRLRWHSLSQTLRKPSSLEAETG